MENRQQHNGKSSTTQWEIVNNTMESFKKQERLSTSIAKKLFTNDLRTPQFHILPKIHKRSIEDQSLAQLNAILARFPNLLTTTLKHTQKHYHLISKTADFINKINGVKSITGDVFLVTLDVNSLHLGEIFWILPQHTRDH